MAHDESDQLPGDTVVVMGGGPCGAMAALRLVQANIDVTLLDSGLRSPAGIVAKIGGRTVFRWVDRRPLHANRHVSATDPSTTWYSSLSLGGLSNYWTGAVPRFAPEDFSDGGRLDERYEWPIGYDDLAPYYSVVEEIMRVTAGEPIPGVPVGRSAFEWRMPPAWRDVAATARVNDFPMGVLPVAKGTPWMIAFRGNEFDSYHGIVRPAMRTGRLRLIRGGHAVRLIHDGGVASAVEYLDAASGSHAMLQGRAFVVAAGALDTTELLMRSTSSEHPQGLGSSHGVLGRYLHDHPREWYPVHLSRPLPALTHPVYLARRPADRSAALMGVSSTLGMTSMRDRLRTFHGGTTPVVGVQAFGTMIPSPDHGVKLADRDATTTTSASRLHIDLVYDEATVTNIELGRDRLRDAFASAGIGSVAGPFHPLSPGSSVHFGGTARMHRNVRFGVVDEWNRVFDAPNVVVCDASCFTTGPEKNPTLTAMAIAARAADRLASTL